MEDRGTQVKHVFRKANQLADHIANTTIIDSKENPIFRSFNHLPSIGRNILNMDKHEIPLLSLRKSSDTNISKQAQS